MEVQFKYRRGRGCLGYSLPDVTPCWLVEESWYLRNTVRSLPNSTASQRKRLALMYLRVLTGLNGTATVRNEVRLRVCGGVGSVWTASDDSSEGLVVTIRTASITVNNSTFCPHSEFVCFVWIWEQTAISSLYSINWQVFITETESVYCAVRILSSYKTPVEVGIQTVK